MRLLAGIGGAPPFAGGLWGAVGTDHLPRRGPPPLGGGRALARGPWARGGRRPRFSRAGGGGGVCPGLPAPCSGGSPRAVGGGGPPPPPPPGGTARGAGAPAPHGASSSTGDSGP